MRPEIKLMDVRTLELPTPPARIASGYAQKLRQHLIEMMVVGGRGRDRTGDPLLAKQVLSQLSYTPIVRFA
jgi:hypothetical protein